MLSLWRRIFDDRDPDRNFDDPDANAHHLFSRDPKRGVSDYHQRRMFAHGYHFITQQVTLLGEGGATVSYPYETPMKNTEIEKEANTLSLHNSTGCNDDKYRNREANTETDRQKNTETV